MTEVATNPNRENMQRAVGILQKGNVRFWVDQGTLLGIIRDGELLPWDKDIDLSVWDEDFLKLKALQTEFEDAGFYFELHEEGDCLFLSKGDGYFVDIARYRNEDGMAIRSITAPKVKPWQRALKRAMAMLPSWFFIRLRHICRTVFRSKSVQIRVPASMFEELDSLEFEGMRLLKPAETEAYLELKYGDWRTPVSEWDYSKQDGGICEI